MVFKKISEEEELTLDIMFELGVELVDNKIFRCTQVGGLLRVHPVL